VHEDVLDDAMKKRADFLVEKEKLFKDKAFYKHANYFIADELVLYVLG
jgi:hypothetical protein